MLHVESITRILSLCTVKMFITSVECLNSTPFTNIERMNNVLVIFIAFFIPSQKTSDFYEEHSLL